MNAAAPSPQPRPWIKRLVWTRRFCQGGFLALFAWLLVETVVRIDVASASERVRLRWPVEAFLLVDPFLALTTLLSSHVVHSGLLWALVVVGLTVVVGRAFCGWICPFGTLHQVVAWLWPSRYGKGTRRIEQNKTHPVRQRVKSYLLYAAVGAGALGSAVGGWLDPLCLLVRGLGLALFPASHWVALAGADAVTRVGGRVPGFAAGWLANVIGSALTGGRQLAVHGGWLLGAILLALFVMDRFVPRFWCRVLCPLGALLGLLSRFSLVGMRKREERCTHCNKCLLHCQGADSPQAGVPWRQDECHLCLNCEASCPEGVIRFGWLPSRQGTRTTPDTQRRTALASAAAGAVLVPLLRASDGLRANAWDRRIRPPGSLDEPEFLARCVRCGECMKVCPNNALHPVLLEAGVEALWTPVLIPRIGYCEQSCVLCAQVCPTGAIRRITEEARLGIGQQPISIGTAFFDHGRCLPWAMGRPCLVCEEHCPTSPKAIWVETVEVPIRPGDGTESDAASGATRRLGRPHLDPARCIGCGACEHVCPVRDRAGVTVSSVGESRSPTNTLLL